MFNGNSQAVETLLFRLHFPNEVIPPPVSPQRLLVYPSPLALIGFLLFSLVAVTVPLQSGLFTRGF